MWLSVAPHRTPGSPLFAQLLPGSLADCAAPLPARCHPSDPVRSLGVAEAQLRVYEGELERGGERLQPVGSENGPVGIESGLPVGPLAGEPKGKLTVCFHFPAVVPCAVEQVWQLHRVGIAVHRGETGEPVCL